MNERTTIYFQSIKVKFVKHNKGEKIEIDDGVERNKMNEQVLE